MSVRDWGAQCCERKNFAFSLNVYGALAQILNFKEDRVYVNFCYTEEHEHHEKPM